MHMWQVGESSCLRLKKRCWGWLHQMKPEMAKTTLAHVADAILTYLRDGVERPFADVVEHAKAEVAVDEATAKAVILRLNSEGQIEITPDWTVCVPREQVAKAA